MNKRINRVKQKHPRKLKKLLKKVAYPANPFGEGLVYLIYLKIAKRVLKNKNVSKFVQQKNKLFKNWSKNSKNKI